MSLCRLMLALLWATIPAAAFPAGPDFAGTAWQLVAIHSMDDAQGTSKIAEPSRFTLEFGRDGRAAFRLDCNRGMSDYKLTPADDGVSGAIAFGPIAATRALCPPPHVDERIARDMADVRSYVLKDGRLYLTLMADGGIYEWVPVHAAGTGQDPDRVVKPLRFAKGKRETVLRDRIVGRQYVDYQVPAGAGQRLRVSLKGSNRANYFNLLPPGSSGDAMAIGEFSANRFDGVLPDDGLYTLRVFLLRSAGRRGEASDYTLSVDLAGAPLKPVSARIDAVLAGTRFHARTTVNCQPADGKARECEAYVVRRGYDGSATVELRWDSGNGQTAIRRILFVKGEPTAADGFQTMTFTRDPLGWRVSFNGNDYFEVPEPLVFGG